VICALLLLEIIIHIVRDCRHKPIRKGLYVAGFENVVYEIATVVGYRIIRIGKMLFSPCMADSTPKCNAAERPVEPALRDSLAELLSRSLVEFAFDLIKKLNLFV